MTSFSWAVLGGMAILALLGAISTLKRRRSLEGLAELTDEGQTAASVFGKGTVTGHYHGRRVKLSVREGSESQHSQFTLQLSCTAPAVFSLDRPRGAIAKLFGLSPSTVTEAVGMPGSFGFLLERSGVIPRRLLGIGMGGGTGLPLAPIGDPRFDESFCLSASEPARDAVVAWMRTPEVKERVGALFSAERLTLLTLKRDGEVFLAAAVRRFQETDLEPANVRPLLDRLEVIAKSLEKQ